MRKIKIIKHIITLILVVILGFSVTYSWFARSNNIDPQLSDATIIRQYFHTGSGTEEDPFVITRPVHYYNLVQLFQRTSGFAVNGDASAKYYFQLGYELDETTEGLEFFNYDDEGNQINTSGNKYSKELNLEFYNGDNALLPIGTSDIPFNDVFNGSGLTVKNLHVKATETVGDVTFGTADIGIFGYVTEEASISNAYYDDFDIDLTGTDYTRTVSGHNTEVHDGNNNGSADLVYVGYVAGHIVDATCFSNFYINNCEIIGQSSSFKCDWGYFGYCENASTIDQFIERINESQGNNAGWGGSINFKAYNERMYYYLNNESLTIPDIYYGSTSKYANRFRYFTKNDISLTTFRSNDNKTASAKNTTLDSYYANNPNATRVMYAVTGKMTNQTWKSNNYSNTISVAGTVQPLLVDENYQTLSGNTGYLIGGHDVISSGGTYSKTYGLNPSIVSSSWEMRFISNSLGDTFYTETAAINIYNGKHSSYPSFNQNKLEILTNKTAAYSASNYVLIKDDYNSNHTSPITGYTKNNTTTPESLGLVKYNSSREHLGQVLGSSNYIHGIHFRGESGKAASSYINTSNTITINNAKIYDNTYSTYTLPTSCIDFNLKEDGIINFFAGSYYTSKTDSPCDTDSFFSLWKVTRDGTTITSLQQIKRIFKSNDPNAAEKYIYDFTGSTTPSNATLVFDLAYLSNTPPVKNAVYYFEIPVNAGEYAMGVCDNKANGAYLMYLDIGANGNNSTEPIEVDDFATVEYRSANDTIEHNVLILTYKQTSNLTVSIKVVFDKENNCYNIITSANIPITVTILDSSYTYKFNNTTISSEVGSYTLTSP